MQKGRINRVSLAVYVKEGSRITTVDRYTYWRDKRGFQIQDEALLKFLDTPGAEHPRAIH